MKVSKDLFFNAAVFFLYISLVIFGMHNHELWGDEIHSWNIAKGSHTLKELFGNIRYEGHPPFWYLVLFSITHFSHSLFYLKAIQLMFVACAGFVLLFFSPFSSIQKVLILSGYYFIFEYAVLARNYMPAIVFSFCIAAIHNRRFKFKLFCYYFLLLLLSNVHLLGLLLAVAIHSAWCYEKKENRTKIFLHAIAGLLILIPALYFIIPPPDSQLNFQFWQSQWNTSRLYLFITVIVKSLLPFPDPGNIHWWNTNYLLDHDSLIYRSISFLFFILLLTALVLSLKKYRSALVLLLVNLMLTFFLSLIFPLNTARYTGFILIGYIVAYWHAMDMNRSTSSAGRSIFMLILVLQLPAGIFALAGDREARFSEAQSVIEMEKQIPAGSFVATDYWCLNNLSAYLDTSFYCIELNRSVSFLQWNSGMRAVMKYDYADGLYALLMKNNGKPFCFFSIHDSDEIFKNKNSQKKISLTLIAKSGVTIEKSGGVFLYRVEKF
jgi:hypothetical protein